MYAVGAEAQNALLQITQKCLFIHTHLTLVLITAS